MKPYEISIWEDRLVQREDLKNINVYSGLDTDPNDLSFWYTNIKTDDTYFKLKNIDNGWIRTTVGNSGYNYAAKVFELKTGLSFLKPNTDYTLVFEANNFEAYFEREDHGIVGSGELFINAQGLDNMFNNIWSIKCTEDGFELLDGSERSNGKYFVSSNQKGFVFIAYIRSQANFIKSSAQVGLNTQLKSYRVGGPEPGYWLADLRCALYEGHDVFNNFYNNESSTYEDFYSLENTYFPYFTEEREYFKEYKLAIIGSEKMSAPYRVINPVFTSNVNGTSSLSFSMYSKYYDTDEEKMVENPFIKYMINERKIKLKYENKWYDLVIKNISESSEDYRFDYIAKDLFINELSKIGFNKTFQTELLNNTGTVIELGNEVLSGTDWEIDEQNSDLLYQTLEDRLYQVTTNFSIIATKYKKTDSGIEKTLEEIPAKSNIMVFYSYLSSQNSQLDFLYSKEGYFTDMNNIISNADYYIIDGAIYREDSKYPYLLNENEELELFFDDAILDMNKIGEKYVSSTERIYYAPLDRYVTIYKNKNGEKRYGYVENEYETTPITMNLITNSSNFTDTSGWETSNGFYAFKGDHNIRSRDIKVQVQTNVINNNTYSGINIRFGDRMTDDAPPDNVLSKPKKGTHSDSLYTGYFSGHLINSGFSDNASYINTLKKGDEYVLRLTLSFETDTSFNILSSISPLLVEYNKTEISSNPNIGNINTSPNQKYNSYLMDFCYEPYLNKTDGIHNFSIYDPNYLIPIYPPKSYNINIPNAGTQLLPEFESASGDFEPICYVYRGNFTYWHNIENFGTKYFEFDSSINGYRFTTEGYQSWLALIICKINNDFGNIKNPFIDSKRKVLIPLSKVFSLTSEQQYNFIGYQYLPFNSENQQGEYYKYDGNKNDNEKGYWHMLEKNEDISDDDKIKIHHRSLEEFLSARNIWKIIQLDSEVGKREETNGEDINTSYINKNFTIVEARGVYEGNDLNYSDLLTKNIGLFLQSFSNVSLRSGMTLYNVQLYKAYKDDEGNTYTPEAIPGSTTRKIYRYFNPEDINNIEITEVSEATPLIYEYEGYVPSKDYTAVINDKCIKKNSIIDTESNCYNLIQKICEVFECWSKFEIEHLENGEIKLNERYRPIKKVSFKEYVGKDNPIGFKYGVNLNSIKRTLDSEQFVSKIIVKNNSNEYGEDGFCSIARAENNPTGENYIFDFSYYINQGLLNKDKTITDLYNDYYPLLNIRKKHSEEYVKERKRLKILVASLKALYETYKLAMQNTESLLADYKDKFTQLTEYSYSYYVGTLSSKDEKYENNLTFRDYKTKIEYYTNLLTGFRQLVTSSKKDYDSALKDYQHASSSILRIAAEKEKLYSSFYKRYSYYIQEGSWISEDYMDDDKYYFEALRTLQTSSKPKVSYTINVSDISSADEFENYKFDIGDKTYIQDTEFFGWEEINGIKTPYKEEVIISEISNNLDESEKTQIKVQNYKTQFEDLFQRMAATVQAVQYGTGKYSDIKTSEISENRFDKLNNQISGLQAQLKYIT